MWIRGIRGGTTVCYLLEDIDLHQQSTYHGPACTYQMGSAAQSSGTQSQEGTSNRIQQGAALSGPGPAVAIIPAAHPRKDPKEPCPRVSVP